METQIPKHPYDFEFLTSQEVIFGRGYSAPLEIQALPSTFKLSTQNNSFEEKLGGSHLLQAAKARGTFPLQTIPISSGATSDG